MIVYSCNSKCGTVLFCTYELYKTFILMKLLRQVTSARRIEYIKKIVKKNKKVYRKYIKNLFSSWNDRPAFCTYFNCV